MILEVGLSYGTRGVIPSSVFVQIKQKVYLFSLPKVCSLFILFIISSIISIHLNNSSSTYARFFYKQAFLGPSWNLHLKLW